MKGAQGSRCSIARSTLLVLLLAGCCFSTPLRPQHPSSEADMSAENTTADQKPARNKGQKPNRQELWWANPCAVPGGADLTVLSPVTSSEELEMLNMKNDPSLTETWVIQLKNAIEHIKKIEEQYDERLPLVLNKKAWIRNLVADIALASNMEEIQYHLAPENATYAFLPKVSSIFKRTKVKTVKAVTELYKGLQRFAVAIECMMGHRGCRRSLKKKMFRTKRINKSNMLARLNDDKPVSVARMNLLKEIKEHLRTLLCEVQTFLRSVKKQLPAPPNDSIMNEEWIPEPSETEKIVQKVIILYNYKSYLHEWLKISDTLLESVDPKKRKGPKGGRAHPGRQLERLGRQRDKKQIIPEQRQRKREERKRLRRERLRLEGVANSD